MKKSKVLMISSLALAMVASLVMAFAMMNVTKAEPVSVSAAEDAMGSIADGFVRVYFYNIKPETGTNAVQWGTSDVNKIQINAWGGDGTGVVDMTPVTGTDWWFYDVKNNNTKINFHAPSWGSGFDSWTAEYAFDSSKNVFYVTNANSGVNRDAANISFNNPLGTTTYYFHNTASWTKVFAHCWLESGGTDYIKTTWGNDPELADYSGDWKSLTVYNIYDSVIFKDAAGDTVNQSGDKILNKTANYYLNGIWAPNAPDADRYYIIGSKTSWVLNLSNVMDAPAVASENKGYRAEKVYTADENEQFRVIKGDGTWSDTQGLNTVIGVGLERVDDNLKAVAERTYLVTVDKDGKTWVTDYIGGVKSKASSDPANGYILLVAGFNLLTYSSADEVGYIIRVDSGEISFDGSKSTHYYSAVSLPTAGDDVIKNPSYFGYNDSTDKLIVHEIAATSGPHTYTAQAQIFKTVEYENNSYEVAIACSSTVSGSVTYTPAV